MSGDGELREKVATGVNERNNPKRTIPIIRMLTLEIDILKLTSRTRATSEVAKSILKSTGLGNSAR